MNAYIGSETDLEIAATVAEALVARGADPNEVAGCVTFLNGPHADQFFLYLDRVIAEGDSVARSKQTVPYYRAIREVCREHLGEYRDTPHRVAYILGWAVRLMRYQKAAGGTSITPGHPMKKPAPQSKTRSAPSPAPPAPSSGQGRYTGRVKFYNTAKGFGFITPDAGGGKDVFVHKSNVAGQHPLSDGQRVSYTIGPGNKGPQALDVKPE